MPSAATEANILHAAAFLEFKQHVERLAREGQDLAAYTCWTHAVGIRHSPFVIPITSEFDMFPPLVKMPCCKRDCQRCTGKIGGFKFPWLGVVEQRSSRGVIIPPDVQPENAWACYYEQQEKMDLLLLDAYWGSGTGSRRWGAGNGQAL